ncbi:Centrosomal protein of 170 kDa protein B-like [Homarus americanus]|uniref:Centrosomal protein of 170 kDa protein B-like n=1 Tax=Homarus americanus TaxID=6706 RepID=A0A8J5JQV8_HOMAM|nr:Centrosomal protein of 170 kDa protein B-like [Homarus americanus]
MHYGGLVQCADYFRNKSQGSVGHRNTSGTKICGQGDEAWKYSVPGNSNYKNIMCDKKTGYRKVAQDLHINRSLSVYNRGNKSSLPKANGSNRNTLSQMNRSKIVERGEVRVTPGIRMSPKKVDFISFIAWRPEAKQLPVIKVEERSGKPPVGRPRSGTIGATGLQQGRRGGGYHSEGYFSSDQDDEGPRRTDLKSPHSPRTPELRSPQTPQRLVRSSSQDSAKGASLRMRTPSPDNASRASHAMTLNESASYLIEKLMNNTPESQRYDPMLTQALELMKQPGKTEGRTCCKADKKPTVAEVTGRSKSEKGTKSTVKMTPEGQKQSNSANSLSSCQTYDVKQELESVGGKEEKDDVSEAGTYTIEKDSSSPEVEQARNDIDRVFGVSGTESEVDVVTPRGNAPTEEAWTPTPESDKFKV